MERREFQNVRGKIDTMRLQSIDATLGMATSPIGAAEGGPRHYESGWFRETAYINRDIRECWDAIARARRQIQAEIDRIEREAKEEALAG